MLKTITKQKAKELAEREREKAQNYYIRLQPRISSCK